jgi:hypothetical protein
MWQIICRDLSVYHLWRHANHLANMSEHLFVDKGTLQENVRSILLCILEIALFPGDHAFVSS